MKDVCSRDIFPLENVYFQKTAERSQWKPSIAMIFLSMMCSCKRLTSTV